MKPLFFISLLLIVSGLSSCDSRGGSSLTRATGIAYEVIVVMDKVLWDSEAGTAVREELTAPIPYLFQAESSMKYTYIRPDQFDGFLKNVRNILIVNIQKDVFTKAALLKEDDKWARGQLVMYLNAPDVPSVETYLSENQNAITNYFTKEEMKRTAEFLRKTYSYTVMEMVKEKYGITLYAPSEIKSFKKGDEGLWFSNDAASGHMNLLVYSFPYVDTNTFTLDYLVAKRDSFLKEMMPGAIPGSYMSTEKRVVDYFASTLNGKYCGVLRGLWRMEGGDMMGGPFVSYARVDEPNRRVIVTEGFVYEPRRDKGGYIRRLEAALQTTRFPDEMIN